jgi:hypothetical protein
MIVQVTNQTKAAVSVAEMARMVGLSRARFYQLMGEGVFPKPVYHVSTKRPIFVEEAQKVCLEVRRRNCGVNGKPVLFYARRGGSPTTPTRKRSKANTTANKQYVAIVDAIRALGLVSATADQVGQAIKSLFPTGTEGTAEAEIIRAVFVHLQRRVSSDNVGR